jgi:hypothetical protein
MKYRLLILLIFVSTINSLACVCFFSFDKKYLNEITKDADIIFIGKVVEVTFNQDSTIMTTQLLLVEKIKGNLNSQVAIEQKTSRGCGAGYRMGMNYLVLGNFTATNEIHSDGCSSWTYEQDAGIAPFDKPTFDRLVREFKKRVK